MNKHKMIVEKKDRQLILHWDFNASRDLLFKVWSDCKHLKHWWGPKEWPMEECTMDFRVGGEWRYCLRGPNEGDESWGLAVYQEIEKPARIAYQDYFTDAEGNVMEEMPELRSTVEFTQQGDQTRQTVTVYFDTDESRDKILEMGMVEGLSSSLERLVAYLPELNV